MAALPIPRDTQMLSLAVPMNSAAAIHFEPGLRTFSLNENCIGVEVPPEFPRLSRSNHSPIAIYHAGHTLQIWSTGSRIEPIRVLLVDYDLLPRRRQIIGNVTFGHVPGDIRISDFRHSLANGIIPNIMRKNTVYILGLRFANKDVIPASVLTFDLNGGTEFAEQMEINYNDHENIYIRCNEAVSTRAIMRRQSGRDVNPRRYAPEVEIPTVVRNWSTERHTEPVQFMTPRPRILEIATQQKVSETVRPIKASPPAEASNVDNSKAKTIPKAESTPRKVTGAIPRSSNVRPPLVRPQLENLPPISEQVTESVIRDPKIASSQSAQLAVRQSHEELMREMKHCHICDMSTGSTEDKLDLHIRNYHIQREDLDKQVVIQDPKLFLDKPKPIDPRYPYWNEYEPDNPRREDVLQRRALRRYSHTNFVNEGAPDREKQLKKAWSIEKLHDERLAEEVELDKLSDCGESIVSERPANEPNRRTRQDDDDYVSITDGDLQQHDFEQELRRQDEDKKKLILDTSNKFLCTIIIASKNGNKNFIEI